MKVFHLDRRILVVEDASDRVWSIVRCRACYSVGVSGGGNVFAFFTTDMSLPAVEATVRRILRALERNYVR